jgi:hypothetical protein
VSAWGESFFSGLPGLSDLPFVHGHLFVQGDDSFNALNSFDIFWLLLSQPMHQVISGSVQVWLCHPLVNVAGIKVHG